MTQDAWLAAAHHLAVFGVAALIATELALVRPGLRSEDLPRLVRIDRAYGIVAGVVFVVGLARLEFGAKEFGFYADNPFFWLKLGTFATVGFLSIGPTRRFVRWARSGAAPADADVAAARRGVIRQVAVFPFVPVFATLMARGIGA
jgi:putative membrane protein